MRPEADSSLTVFTLALKHSSNSG